MLTGLGKRKDTTVGASSSVTYFATRSNPDFNRADLKAMLASEVDIQEGNTRASDDVKADRGLAGNSDDE